jgi:hypothetical protein
MWASVDCRKGKAVSSAEPRTARRALLQICCKTPIPHAIETHQAGRWTRPDLGFRFGAPRRNRTGDPILTMDVLYRLS